MGDEDGAQSTTGRWLRWWVGEQCAGDWVFPAARVQGFRLVGGALVGTADAVRFVPNRLESRFGGRHRRISRPAIAQVTMGWRRLRITTTDGEPVQTFMIARRRLALRHLSELT